MNRKINISVLIFFCVTAVILFMIAYKTVGANKVEIEEMLMSSQREIQELNNVISANDIVFEQTMKTKDKQLNDYELLISRWIEYDYFTVSDLSFLKKSYDLSVMVHVEGNSFSLPRNGMIHIDSNTVEIEIKYKIPPVLRDKALNYRVHYYDSNFEDIKFDDPDEYYEDENTIRIKYVGLEVGDERNIFLGNELKYLLNLTESRVQIVITNDFLDSKEYRPINIKEKKFTGGLFKEGFIHYFTYLTDGSWVLETDDVLKDFILTTEYDEAKRLKFEYDEELKVSGISTDDLEFNTYDRIILPSKLRLGTSWKDQTYTAMITGVDFPMDTGLGILNTVEVTYKDEEGYVAHIDYYAKNLGLVYRSYTLNEDVLYEVTYYK